MISFHHAPVHLIAGKKSEVKKEQNTKISIRKEEITMSDEEIKNEDKLIALLSYIFLIPSLIFLFTDKKNIRFCRYHGWQSLFFGLAIIILNFALGIISVLPVIGWIIGMLLYPVMGLLGLAWLVMAIIFGIKAYNGEYVVIPFITDFAKKYVDEA